MYQKQLDIRIDDFKPYPRITINHIFSHNHNWDVYELKHRHELRDVEVKEVRKMLECGKKGFKLFRCPKCGEEKVVYYGCNSRICTHCGKKFTDKWSEGIAKETFDVKHRHVVLTIPEQLRPFFKTNRKLLKVLMDCAILTIAQVMRWKLGKEVTPGVIAVLHTYGRDMKWNPHVHALVTEGGFKGNGEWVNVNVFPYRMLRRAWQYHLLMSLKNGIDDTYDNRLLVHSLFQGYREGFYVRAKDTINNKRGMVKYIGRYVRHPAIAESRIESYDGESVTFWYLDDDGVRQHVTMSVEEFITAVIGHIPDKQFKTVRHYGIYARNQRRFFKKLLGVVSILQKKILNLPWLWAPECPKCGAKMEFVYSSGMDKPPPEFEPPEEPRFGERIIDWSYITSSSISR
ncbi:MAG: transposase [Hadesarchaea archaeon]|nr:transposase [Hadesarchaea archaeon]